MESRINAVTLYDRIKPGSLWLEVPLLGAFNLVLVLSAYVSFSLPFSPVPITGQTLGVLLIAMALGSTRGTAVVAAYLLEGLAGFPVFAGGSGGAHVFMGATGGYLVGFAFAAFAVGWLADRGWSQSLGRTVAAMALGTGVIFAAGLSQLALFVPTSALLTSGLWPFLPGAVLKIAAASALLPLLWRFLGRRGE